MKKILFITISIALIIALMAVCVGCNYNDEIQKLQKAVSSCIESANSLDKASAEDLNGKNITLAVNEYKTEVMLSVNSLDQPAEEQTLGQKIMEVVDCLDYVKAKQLILDETLISAKAQLNALKSNAKVFRNQGLILDEQEKTTLIMYVDEVNAQRETIKSTIGKVYLAIREAKQLYTLATIDEALIVLSEVCAQMDIRVEAIATINTVIIDANDILNSKFN